MKKILVVAALSLLFCFSACKKHDVEINKYYTEYTDIIFNGGDDCAKIAKELNAFADSKGAAFDKAIRDGMKSSQRETIAKDVLGNPERTKKLAENKCKAGDVAFVEAFVRIQKLQTKAQMEALIEIAPDSDKETLKKQLETAMGALDTLVSTVKAAAAAPAAAPEAAPAADDAGAADEGAEEGGDAEDQGGEDEGGEE